MTEIEILTKDKNKIVLKSQGHCQHDICVSISALVNSVIQFTKEFEAIEKCRYKAIYEYGNVFLKINFINADFKKDFLNGIKAVLSGLELYQFNFPKDVKFKINGVVTSTNPL